MEMASRTSDYTVFIVHDPKCDDVQKFRSEDEAYAAWRDADGASCDAYNAAEKWSMPMDAQFEDYRDEEKHHAHQVARHHERLAMGARLAS
jgi:hypothetical protein